MRQDLISQVKSALQLDHCENLPSTLAEGNSFSMEPCSEGNLMSMNDNSFHQGDVSIQVEVSHQRISPKGAVQIEIEEVKAPESSSQRNPIE